MAKVAAKPRKQGGIVVTYSPPEQGYADSHENATRIEIGKSLAALKGFEFAGEYDPSARHDGPVYFVPSDALPIDTGLELGIYTDNDLFGGIVPHAFAATKAITHTLVAPDAHAPAGWSHGFGGRVRAAVLMGFTAFALEDARRAGAKLLERGPVRIKPVREAGGRGQFVACDGADLLATLDAMDPSELACSGVVLEENLSEVTTYSVGRVRVADLLASYYGCQRLTRDSSGTAVYGGSDLAVVRGNFEALLQLDLPEDVRLAVVNACAYDCAAMEFFPGFFASRRNYDVASGFDAAGKLRCGVLEQSWRIGGASGAEIAALEAFRREPNRQFVRASTFEIYGESDPPPRNATIHFRGTDERVGMITKYALIDHDHGR